MTSPDAAPATINLDTQSTPGGLAPTLGRSSITIADAKELAER